MASLGREAKPRVGFRRRLGRFVARLVAVLLVIGPWPVDPTPYTDRPWFRDTVRRLESVPVRRGLGRLRVGVGRADLAGPRAVPPAGFVGSIMQPASGSDTACQARAITVAVGPTAVTVVGADLLLIDEALSRSVLRRVGLTGDEVFFTATHTHSGPGGWGIHPLERLVAGTFDPDEADHLAGAIAEAIRRSRDRLEAAEVAFVRADCPGLQRNRIDPALGTNDTLSAWTFRSASPAGAAPRGLATLAVFGAHATIGHPDPPRLGGDYPAAFAAALASRADVGVVLFAAGTVGDASPVRPAEPTQRRSIEAYGSALAGRLADLLPTAQFAATTDLASLVVDVDLPPVQVPLVSASLRLSPAATWWIAPRRTTIRALRLGPATLVGFPGDVAGHLARGLEGPTPIVATSFNGDYKGYLVGRSTFRERSCYETRGMSFFGPDLGEMLVDVARRGLVRLDGSRPGAGDAGGGPVARH